MVSRVFSLDYFLIRTMRFKFIADIVSKYQIGPIWVCSSDSPFPTSNGFPKRMEIRVTQASSVVVRVALVNIQRSELAKKGNSSRCVHVGASDVKEGHFLENKPSITQISLAIFLGSRICFGMNFVCKKMFLFFFFSLQITKSM